MAAIDSWLPVRRKEKRLDNKQRKQVRFSAWFFVVALVLATVFRTFLYTPYVMQVQEVPYSEFREQLAAGNIKEVTLDVDKIYYTCCETVTDGNANEVDQQFSTIRVEDPALIDDLLAAGVIFSAEDQSESFLTTILGWALTILPLVAIWYFAFRRMGQLGGGGAGVMSVGKSKAREIAGELTGVKFEDVGGVDEVEVELKEIIDFLKDPARFTKLGAKLPKGVLLVGPPGTGKTLLARATAGEAGVPFFSINGSDFVEMFVGVGAARVRDLFVQAKAKAPCIVFIDEIDAIGQSRSTVGSFGSNDEREQTLNQLLSEMDGFEANAGVIIMGATNRPEILDRALLRPGRFDRQVEVSLPTDEGRRQILDIHTRGVSLAPGINLGRIAQITPGFSGADLANIVNEAALLAVRRNSNSVTMVDFDLAIERVVAGLQRKMPLKPAVRRRVAYHEGGHALVAQLLPHTDPVHKVSIIPTAKGALGYTMQMPDEDQYLLSEQELRERMAVMLGGRAAELLIFDDVSTGAANDLERATELARRMITEFGMNEKLGPVRYAPTAGAGYLDRITGTRSDLSPETTALIDVETRSLIQAAQDQAFTLLRVNEEALNQVATVLQEHEVISGEQIREIARQFALTESE